MNTAILLLAGSSERFQSKVKKQFIEINNKPLFLYTFETFYNLNEIDHVVLVIDKKDETLVRNYLQNYNDSNKISIVYGGKSRQESVFNALNYLDSILNSNDNVLIHDAARVLVKKDLILNILENLETNIGVIPVVPVSDSLITNENDKIKDYLNRDEHKLVQTPQGFKFKDIIIAHQLFKDFEFTDDASMILKMNKPVKIVHGDKLNLKVTTKEDLDIVKYILEARK